MDLTPRLQPDDSRSAGASHRTGSSSLRGGGVSLGAEGSHGRTASAAGDLLLGERSPVEVDGAARGIGRSHGKAILIGEHAVVYGAPAIALPVPSVEVTAEIRDLPAGAAPRISSRLFTGEMASAPVELAPVLAALTATAEAVDLDISAVHLRIGSQIPIGRGMGSSAAVAAAVVDAVADAAQAELSADVRHELIQESERVAHGNPSGLDARTVVAVAPVRFTKGGSAGSVPVGAPLSFVIADSGVPASTAVAVANVRTRREADPEVVDRVITEIGDLVGPVSAGLADADVVSLGASMSRAHELLRAIGVSSPVLDDLVRAAREAGACGAKLTGSGGGGCILALAPTPQAADGLAAALRTAGAPRTWTMTLAPQEGDA